MIAILDNSERAKRVVIFFWIYLGAKILRIVSNLIQYWTLDLIQTGEYTENFWVEWNDLQYGLIVILAGGINVGVIITFIQWFRRAYNNLQRAGYRINYSEGWAAGAWFIPFLNIVRPYKIMKEVWIKTQMTYASRIESHGILRGWWILFLLRGWYDNATTRLSMKSETTADFIRDTQLDLFGSIFAIPAIIVTVMVIKQVSAFEEQFKQQLKIETVGKEQPVLEDNQEEEFY
ncbi:DUF4328 domain-containing protein [Xanthocytophaga agilis]|uniref:DUF4328 domain-containing protein n=1 Tax=Xanthocytophaga agilis TaxID=3048010 RepID=A0AAE3UGX4_9BACT|nr:DUF4328 domain-containing protein [Xanthocytophaga agilis]MDJ1504825.1 DUF4328 domain-containing protein [Xanthocytophaga agilis]